MDIRQEIPIKSFSIDAYICKVENNVCQHLIIRRDSQSLYNTWQMVSGRIEKDETGWQAALREIKEETGLVPDRFYSANIVESFYEASQNCINLVPVFVAILDADQPIRLSHEHNAYRWIRAEEGEQYLTFSRHKELLHIIEARFVTNPPNEFLRIPLNTP